ncbi:MAG TPA: XisI protein [Armatimonadota bacterium]|nr:XisI protein [Armatimonadota bacterium]
MDRMKEYREIIKKLLREREQIARPFLPPGLELVCVFDDRSGCYGLLTLGWMKGERVCGDTLLLRIKDGKVWVEDDQTDAPIAEDLVEAGIPPEEIVLGFQPQEMRAHMDFAA